ncbi:hypothetical protein BJ138DRAFT_1138915 [Hygrophoropsis aurantiaca]|uniref:Uncharacterized protein n=1 Tax=Hygrophoropsis aurantiaca TaxID=72124 RepID=A0ACB8AUK3_9AGAM|nr:hypothetical protein BJ138DRAFT_1138915 [Hygrophoropsis aurantiaca]
MMNRLGTTIYCLIHHVLCAPSHLVINAFSLMSSHRLVVFSSTCLHHRVTSRRLVMFASSRRVVFDAFLATCPLFSPSVTRLIDAYSVSDPRCVLSPCYRHVRLCHELACIVWVRSCGCCPAVAAFHRLFLTLLSPTSSRQLLDLVIIVRTAMSSHR